MPFRFVLSYRCRAGAGKKQVLRCAQDDKFNRWWLTLNGGGDDGFSFEPVDEFGEGIEADDVKAVGDEVR